MLSKSLAKVYLLVVLFRLNAAFNGSFEITFFAAVNHCGYNNGGCSHLCLPVPQFKSSYLPKWSVCACPDHMILEHFSCKHCE